MHLIYSGVPRHVAVVGCSQLVTLRGPARARVGPEMSEVGVIPEGVMLIEDEVIASVGRGSEVQIRPGAEIIDVEGRVVLPGFVDAHTHLVFAGDRVGEFEQRALGRTYQEIAASGGGIRSTVKATRAATEEELLAQALRHSRWALSNGTTTLEAKSGYGLSTDHELKLLRVIQRVGREQPVDVVPTFLGAHAFPDELSREEYVKCLQEDMLPAAASLAEYCDIFVEDRYFTPEEAHRILGKAKSLGLGLRMHVDQLSENGGAELAAELGARTADHLEQTSEAGIEALRSAGVIAVLLPGSVYALGLRKYPTGRAMIEAGVPVVLATDFNPGSSPSLSLPMMMSLACTQMKMTPAEALTAATINAAASLDRAHDRGTLEVGKRADFVVADCADYREIAYWFGVNLVHQVYIRGQRAA